jgi:hypothetical protein
VNQHCEPWTVQHPCLGNSGDSSGVPEVQEGSPASTGKSDILENGLFPVHFETQELSNLMHNSQRTMFT